MMVQEWYAPDFVLARDALAEVMKQLVERSLELCIIQVTTPNPAARLIREAMEGGINHLAERILLERYHQGEYRLDHPEERVDAGLFLEWQWQAKEQQLRVKVVAKGKHPHSVFLSQVNYWISRSFNPQTA